MPTSRMVADEGQRSKDLEVHWSGGQHLQCRSRSRGPSGSTQSYTSSTGAPDVFQLCSSATDGLWNTVPRRTIRTLPRWTLFTYHRRQRKICINVTMETRLLVLQLLKWLQTFGRNKEQHHAWFSRVHLYSGNSCNLFEAIERLTALFVKHVWSATEKPPRAPPAPAVCPEGPEDGHLAGVSDKPLRAASGPRFGLA